MSLRVLLVIALVAAAFTVRTWIDWRSPAASAAATTGAGDTRPDTPATHVAAVARDPVCGAAVDEAQARATGQIATRERQTFSFCSHRCRMDFEADPSTFVPSAPNVGPLAARAR